MSWVLYDLANTIFSMNIFSFYFSLYVRDEVGPERADGIYGLTTAVSMGCIFFLSPLLGALTDQARRRVPFLIASTLVCITFTALLGQGGLVPSLVFFIITNIAYQAGLQFYDALLPEVSTDENRGWIGGIGVGVGYLGSFVGLGAGYLMLSVAQTGKIPLFQVTALLFLIFALPSFFWISERGNPRARGFSLAAVGNAARQVRDTLRASGRYPGLFRFLIGRVFYTDPVNTVIAIMGLYVTNAATRAGLATRASESVAWSIMITAVAFAVVGGFAWGRIVDRIGPKRTLTIVLWIWMADFLLVALAGGFDLPLWTFYITSTVAGLALGGTWASDRPY
ncbi:MAG: MFS transporter, partial [Planctomycetes bacterium]|nr:MFS transporter [Planctomycetota bacterium]